MATDKAYVQRVVEKMFPLEVSARAMFGGYGLYFGGKMFGLIVESQLFIRVTSSGEAMAGRITREAPYPGARSAFKISLGKLNDHDWLLALVETTSFELPAPKPKKSRTT